MGKRDQLEQKAELEKFELQGKKHYRVGVVTEVIECFTIWAKSPQEATELCSKGHGRPAGREGPRPVVVLSTEAGLRDADKKKVNFFGMYDSVRRQAAQAEQPEAGMVAPPKPGSLIEVPKMVIPKGAKLT